MIAETETALQTKAIHERHKELSGLQRECVYKKKVCLYYDTYYIKLKKTSLLSKDTTACLWCR